MKVSAKTNSFIAKVKLKITTVRIPATEIGITTLTNAPNRLNPSIIAASSRSLGIALKNPIKSQVQNGMVKLGYTRTRDQRESCSPRLEITLERGIKRIVGGTK